MVSRMRWDGSLALKLVLAAALVVLGDCLFWQQQQWAGVQGLFGLGLCAALLLARPAVRHDRRALAALGLAALYALAQLWDPSPLAFALFWIALGLATLLPGMTRFGDGWQWFQRLFVHGFKSLFGPLIDLLILARVRRRRPASRAGLRALLPVVALPLAGSVVFALLFAQANPVIAALLDRLCLPSLDLALIPRLMLCGLLALFAWGTLRPRPPRRLLGTFDGQGSLALPGVNLASITLSLIAFNAVFAVQNAMDAAYLSGLARLPQGITLADYAHRGAYPLVATALIATLFVLIALRPGSGPAQSGLVRRLVLVWTGQNLVLVASAALRTWDYVEAYSLTRLRIAALLWMALVAAGLVLIVWRMLTGKSASWLINANLVAAGLLLTPVCFVDLGAVAARWNVRHAREIDGNGAALDLCYLAQLKGSALVSVIAVEQRQLPGDLGRKISALRAGMESNLEGQRKNGGWSLLLDQRLAKAHHVAPRQAVAEPFEGLQCDNIID